MKRQPHRQRRRPVALAMALVALVGILGACGGSTVSDAESPTTEGSAAAETSKPALAASETPADDALAAEESEKPAEASPDETINFAEDPYTLPIYGQGVDTWGIVTTVQEPEPRPDLAETWEAGGVVKKGMEYVTVEVTMENTLDTAVTPDGLSVAFSGTSEGEELSNEDGVPERPESIPPGRTATWTETFAVEDAEDVIFSIYTPTETNVSWFTQEEIDEMDSDPLGQ
ncbi:hypothetical protein AAG589_18685 [Isoptericola sp. F-RaC21]|uniref:hypothetical protein n=1 Tax=Isoptericola sp. F-RaC21 TaxID=3141452 RepID=UPI00315C3D1F